MKIFANDDVRRRDRLLGQEGADRLLRDGEYGIMSMISDGGSAYGIPLNYVWDGGDYIYIHCAPDGRKLREIAAQPRVSFCIVGATNVLPGKFTTEYESVVLDCHADMPACEEERRKALGLIVDKYSPDFKDSGKVYIDKSFARTRIIRLRILRYSGKTKVVSKQE